MNAKVAHPERNGPAPKISRSHSPQTKNSPGRQSGSAVTPSTFCYPHAWGLPGRHDEAWLAFRRPHASQFISRIDDEGLPARQEVAHQANEPLRLVDLDIVRSVVDIEEAWRS